MARCQYLLNDYVGQYNAAICKCTDDKKCQKKLFRRIVSHLCFHSAVQKKYPNAIITSGDGSPTVKTEFTENIERFPESP